VHGDVTGTGCVDAAAYGRPGAAEGAFATTAAAGAVAVLGVAAAFTATLATTTVATTATGAVAVYWRSRPRRATPGFGS
jgi:hypothetical protein